MLTFATPKQERVTLLIRLGNEKKGNRQRSVFKIEKETLSYILLKSLTVKKREKLWLTTRKFFDRLGNKETA